jgi:hypothetical protein
LFAAAIAAARQASSRRAKSPGHRFKLTPVRCRLRHFASEKTGRFVNVPVAVTLTFTYKAVYQPKNTPQFRTPRTSMPAPLHHSPMVVDALQTAKRIPREYLAEELALTVAKWPGYRFFSPLEATRLFHPAYVTGYRQHVARNFDVERAAHLRIGAHLDFKRPNRHLTQLWRARQHADRLGMPYPAYIEFTFDFAARRTRKQPPQPNQLAPSKKAHDAWHALLADYWTAERHRLWLSKEAPMAQYHLTQDIGLAVQIQFRADLLALGTPPLCYHPDFLVQRAVELEQIKVEDCLALMPGPVAHDAIERALAAKADGRVAAYAYPPIAQSDLQPACYALPGIDTQTGAPCQVCPLRQGCDASRAHIVARLVDLTGHSDPIAEEERRKNRARVAKHRMKTRGTHAAAAPA